MSIFQHNTDRKKGHGSSTITLFSLCTGAIIISISIITSTIISPKDHLVEFAPTSTSLYLHFEPSAFPLEFSTYAGASEAAIIIEQQPSYSTHTLIKLKKINQFTASILQKDGYSEIAPTIYHKGSTALKKITAKIPHPPIKSQIQGKITADTNTYQIHATKKSNEIRGLITPFTEPTPDQRIFSSLIKCKTNNQLLNTYSIITKIKTPPASVFTAVNFTDIFTLAKEFAEYNNPTKTTSINQLISIFSRPASLIVDKTQESVIILESTDLNTTKDALLSFIQNTIPITQNRTLPDGSKVKEFFLKPENYLWSNPDSDNIIKLLSDEDKVRLFILPTKRQIIISTKKTTLKNISTNKTLTNALDTNKSFIQINTTNLNQNNQWKNLNNFLNLSSIYAQLTVDKSVRFCAK
jgi:hypothetical protein